MSSFNFDSDSVLGLTHELCGIQSYWEREKVGEDGSYNGVHEGNFARRVRDLLSECSWLTVTMEEVEAGRYNVIAADCPLGDIEMLFTAHLDTATPSDGWNELLGSICEDKYYNLGAIDTKGAIASIIDACKKVGQTKGVGYLFYVDEEYDFKGMDHFIQNHPDVRPKIALSGCGGQARMLVECRGCIEIYMQVRGKSGHASRPREGLNAALALMQAYSAMEALCNSANALSPPIVTSINLGGFYAGQKVKDGTKDSAAEVAPVANKIPDLAWMVVDVRPGHVAITGDALSQVAYYAIDRFNSDLENADYNGTIEGDGNGDVFRRIRCLRDPAEATVWVRHYRGCYVSDPEAVQVIRDAFNHMIESEDVNPGQFGYIDVAEIANLRGASLVCLGPNGGNQHSRDEWVSIPSLIAYRDGCARLLNNFKPKA
ncbi:MAG: M20 family metallopeptidase [Candidatus Uhrbacteria bacterium]|nr:M20 family metallopeptidase [Candidatus Uhrbacteria bacterium]